MERQSMLLHGSGSNFYNKTTFKEFALRWIDEVITVKSSRRTIETYNSRLHKHLIPFVGDVLLSDIKKTHADQLAGSLKRSGHNAKGINLIVFTFKAILLEAKKQEYIFKNPLEFYPKIPEDPQSFSFWTKGEMNQFLGANLKDPLYALYFVALYTGMRKGELAGLCWDRIDFSKNLISVTRIRDNVELKETTKTKLIRHVPMHPAVKELLFGLMKKQNHARFVFTDSNNNPIPTHHLYRDFKIAQEKASMARRIRFHDLRHTFASQFVMNSGSLFDLQKILGHTDVKMTMRYAHHSPEHLQSTLKFFGFGEEKFEEKDIINPFLTLKSS